MREKLWNFYFRKIWKIKPRLLFGTMCWIIAFVDIKSRYRPLSVPDLTNVLKTLQDKLSAFLYCQRDRSPDIFESFGELEESNSIQVFSFVKIFYFQWKAKHSRSFEPVEGNTSELWGWIEQHRFFCGTKVIFPQLLRKVDRNNLLSVQGTLKGKRPPILRFRRPPHLFRCYVCVETSLTGLFLNSFTQLFRVASRLRCQVDTLEDHPPLSVRFSDGVQIWLTDWSPEALEKFCLRNAVIEDPLVASNYV